jgi:antibiotic biosynthesis monooxygenase (ABM) superfamily enzyme
MAVKVLIKRKCIEGKLKEVSKLLIKARSLAMDFPGYYSSETLSEHGHPNNVLVVAMWQKIEDWHNYRDSGQRKTNEAAFEPFLSAPTEYEVYELGLQL